MNDDRIMEIYRGYRLIAAQFKGGFRGSISRSGELIYKTDGNSLTAVHVALKKKVDSIITSAVEAGEISATAQQYAEAFMTIWDEISDRQRLMLNAHFHAPDRQLTATQLSIAADYSGYEAANLQYGILADKLNGILQIDLPKTKDGVRIATFVIADGERIIPDKGEWIWTMKPEVAEAIQHLGLVS